MPPTSPAVRPWLSLLVFAVAVAVAAAVHALRPAPPPPRSVLLSDPNIKNCARLEAKQRITDAIMGGRLTLSEAAAAFRALDDGEGRPAPVPAFIGLAPGTSDEEVYCRVVIAWVRAESPQGRAEELGRSLEAELAARLREGTLRLPE